MRKPSTLELYLKCQLCWVGKRRRYKMKKLQASYTTNIKLTMYSRITQYSKYNPCPLPPSQYANLQISDAEILMIISPSPPPPSHHHPNVSLWTIRVSCELKCFKQFLLKQQIPSRNKKPLPPSPVLASKWKPMGC